MNGFLSLLTPEQQQMARQEARSQGLIGLGSAMLRSAAGVPGQGKPSIGQVIGESAPVGLQAYRGGFENTLQDILRTQQIQELRRRQADEERIRKARETFESRIAGATRNVPATGLTEGGQQATMLAEQMSVFAPEDITGTRQALLSAGATKQVTDQAAADQAVMDYLRVASPVEYARLAASREKTKPLQIDLKNRVVLVDPSDPTKIVGSFDKAQERGESSTTEINLGKSFTQDTASYIGITQAYKKVKAAVDNPSPAGDLSLIFGYMKILDPQSVVREGEFATAQNSGSVPTTVMNLYNRILKGERLSESQRKDFDNQAFNLVKSQKDVYDKTILPRYESIIKTNQLNKQNVLFDPFAGLDFSKTEKPSPATSGGKAPAGVRQELWNVMTPEQKSLWQP